MKIVSSRSALFSLWIGNLVGIFCLSIFGRKLQHWAADAIGYSLIAWLITITLITLISAYVGWLVKHAKSFPWIHLLWFLPLFLAGPFWYDRIEERIHFLSFGLFGAVTILLFSPRLAIAWCLAMSAADETLQHFLVDRVGDLADVMLNSAASLGAMLFVCFTIKPSLQDSAS